MILADLIDHDTDQFIGYTAFLFFVFVIIMSIIIMNLLTGLAVDDIQSIAENAELKKLSMQVKLVLGLERIFSRLRRIFGGEHLQYEEITKQRRHKLLWFLKQDVLSVKNILAQLKREESDSGPLHLHLQ